MSQATEATTEAGEDVLATLEVLRESALSEVFIDPATETSSTRVPYLGEDARMTQLRQFDDLVREMAAKPSKYSTGFPREILGFLPSMTRAWIQMVGELLADKGKVQAENKQLQADDEQLHERISSLLEENGKLDNNIIRLRRKKEELNIEKAGLLTTIDKIGQDLVKVRDERGLLKKKLEDAQILSGPRAESDGEGPTKKRSREN